MSPPTRDPHQRSSADTLKFKLVIAYDGANYAGWQAQKTGLGVQQVVEQALARIFLNTSIGRIHSSSRTDTGVHALGMVAHFELPRQTFRLSVAKLRLALNAHLPADIRVMSAARSQPRFHARFDATSKQYRYQVWNHPSMNPLLRHQAWHVPLPLDLAKMRAAAPLFTGTHDFKSFAGTRQYEMGSTIRTLTVCQIKRRGPLLTFVLQGNGFLYKMCRGIVGTLVQVGQGKFDPSAIRRMLASKDRRAAGMTAPAHGLILWKVSYSKPSRRGHATQS